MADQLNLFCRRVAEETHGWLKVTLTDYVGSLGLAKVSELDKALLNSARLTLAWGEGVMMGSQ